MRVTDDLWQIDPADPPAERWANLLTHALGAGVSVVGIVSLLAATAPTHDDRRVTAAVVYGLGLVLAYGASTCYHACRLDTPLRRRWRTIDHAAIYVFIASSYTPMLLVTLRGPWALALLAAIWAIALAGAGVKLFAARPYGGWSTGGYVAMGWAGLAIVRPLLGALPAAATLWLVAGGVAYTAGVAFYAWRSLRFSHAIWHLFVAAGSLCHFVAIRWYVLG